jgi:hypothetical protein
MGAPFGNKNAAGSRGGIKSKTFKIGRKTVIAKRFVDKMTFTGKSKIRWQSNFKKDWGNKKIHNPPTGSGTTAKRAFGNLKKKGIPAWERYNKKKY